MNNIGKNNNVKGIFNEVVNAEESKVVGTLLTKLLVFVAKFVSSNAKGLWTMLGDTFKDLDVEGKISKYKKDLKTKASKAKDKKNKRIQAFKEYLQSIVNKENVYSVIDRLKDILKGVKKNSNKKSKIEEEVDAFEKLKEEINLKDVLEEELSKVSHKTKRVKSEDSKPEDLKQEDKSPTKEVKEKSRPTISEPISTRSSDMGKSQISKILQERSNGTASSPSEFAKHILDKEGFINVGKIVINKDGLLFNTSKIKKETDEVRGMEAGKFSRVFVYGVHDKKMVVSEVVIEKQRRDGEIDYKYGKPAYIRVILSPKLRNAGLVSTNKFGEVSDDLASEKINQNAIFKELSKNKSLMNRTLESSTLSVEEQNITVI